MIHYFDPYGDGSTDCRHCDRPLRMHDELNVCPLPKPVQRAEPYTDISPADARRSTENLASQAAAMREFKPVKPMNPWHPMTRPVDLKHLGKLGEELGECGAAVSRCIIQGIDEKEPVTGKPNRQWLEEELADVYANIDLVIDHFGLDHRRIFQRRCEKKNGLRAWHQELE